MTARDSLARTRGHARIRSTADAHRSARDASNRPMRDLMRTCADCGRTALDVMLDRDGVARCYSAIGCQGVADRELRRLKAGTR